MSQYFTDLSQTMASDLPYTKEGLLDFGALCRDAGRHSNDARMNQMRQAIHGFYAIVNVLQTDDGNLCSFSPYVRGGLLDALSAMLNTLAMDAEWIDEQRSKEGQP